MNPAIFSASKAAAVSASSSTASLFSEASASSGMKSASNATFAADELDSVFRIGSTNDSSTHNRHDDHLARDSSLRRRRFISPSFATDGELSTFSEEENDASDASDDNQESVSSIGIHLSFRQSNRRNIFYPSRRVQSPLSDIFRMPISGTKRQCEDMMDDDDQNANTTNTRPLLCRANHICSSDNSDDCSTSSSSEESLDDQVMLSSPRSSKRMCLSRNDSPSSYISLFSVTSPATIDYRGADSAIITPKRLEHPLASSGSLIES